MAIELRSEEPSPQVIASDNISLGYEYVCCAKRPYADSVLSLLLWPGFLAFGLLHLRRGRIQSRSRHEKALAGFYVIDLAHNWASILLLVGHLRLVWLRKVIFGWIARAYCRLLRCFPKEMNWEYFYIRYLESRILAGRAPRGFRTQRKLEWIRHMFQCTQQPGHVRNVEAMLAFLAFVKDPYSPGIALHLKEARRGLNRRSPPTVRLRLLLFRRFLEPRRVSLGRALCLAWRYSVPRKITGAHA